ncbi:PREDICTED: tigger transposable element-derived protein 1-like [Rhagoletis zephyria]|uniref:tigger transposable element-derived protein 1-like n=1 Tax=Rhagoletis zephyria TaxID=28612 RepID=UPI00081176DF|nr:PREDICTED: tigger transposable element-derived protein 1-like [Rhagoletis zephyria]XP_017472026.1 PREDICTED: tigger transposable element-derived protein 1-like [Rhagoletis zephyria]XP_017472027.1 PREDICTED: tigger transposable element-derived protein 1-like [Rhagoletis zephyria]
MFSRKRPDESQQANGDCDSKRRRRCLTIEEKIKLLDRLKAGERPMDLSREFEISDSTIRSLVNSETQLRKYGGQCTKNGCSSAAYIPRDEVQEKMEQQLYSWYEEQRQKKDMQSITNICAKARALYAQLKDKDERSKISLNTISAGEAYELQFDDREFKASKSWFMKFRKRFNLEFRSVYKTEPLDPAAADMYPSTFAKLVETGGYQPHQVFTAFELSFAWKRMPSSTFVAKMDKSREKIRNYRISLLLCGNAKGNFHVKPMLINRARNPYCLRTAKFNDLPVFWRSRSRTTQSVPKVTASHLHDWLTLCFTPTARNYLKEMEMPQRCLLLLGYEMQQLVFPTYDDSFLRVEFLPENTSPLLQPLTQSVVPLFQCKYLRRFYEHLLHNLGEKSIENLYKVWHKYSIADAIEIIHESIGDISVDFWKGGWSRLWPKVIRESNRNSIISEEITHCAFIGNQLPGEGFFNMTTDDIRQYLKLDDIIPCDGEQEQEAVSNQVIIEKSSPQVLNIVSSEDVDNESDELISLCSAPDSHCNEANDDAAEMYSDDENEITIQFDETEDGAMSEIEQTDEEAVIEFHETEDFNLDEISQGAERKTSLQIYDIQKQNHSKARIQIGIINKALSLTHELTDTIKQLETHANFTDFAQGLEDLMQPYANLKKQLLQPSIKDYYSK